MTSSSKIGPVVMSIGIVFLLGFSFVFVAKFPVFYNFVQSKTQKAEIPAETPAITADTPPTPKVLTPWDPGFHIATPDSVRSVYMTSWVAATPTLRKKIVDLVDTTEINAIVIDIKDVTGRVSFRLRPDEVMSLGFDPSVSRIKDIDDFIRDLHARNIYVIGRVMVFEDPFYATFRPNEAVHNRSGGLWSDHKGIAWVDPGSIEDWKYIVSLSDAAYQRGFDEINLDYIRFPTDGSLQDMVFPIAQNQPRRAVLKNFFEYVGREFKNRGIPLSVDLFGFTTSNTDDLGIGQVIEDALPNVDFVAPMIYPSHYPPGFLNFTNPAAHPKEVVTFALSHGRDRAAAMGIPANHIRPWLQDFDMGAHYTPEMVRAQIDAAESLGMTSWMMWDAANTYTTSAYKSPQPVLGVTLDKNPAL